MAEVRKQYSPFRRGRVKYLSKIKQFQGRDNVTIYGVELEFENGDYGWDWSSDHDRIIGHREGDEYVYQLLTEIKDEGTPREEIKHKFGYLKPDLPLAILKKSLTVSEVNQHIRKAADIAGAIVAQRVIIKGLEYPVDEVCADFKDIAKAAKDWMTNSFHNEDYGEDVVHEISPNVFDPEQIKIINDSKEEKYAIRREEEVSGTSALEVDDKAVSDAKSFKDRLDNY